MIKQNSKAFYSYAKARQKTRSKTGPFVDPITGKLNPSSDYASEVLSKLYNSVFSQPRPEWSVQDTKSFFKVEENMLASMEVLHNIQISEADIEEACKELKANSSPGPDGVPSIFLNECRKELSGPLEIFF